MNLNWNKSIQCALEFFYNLLSSLYYTVAIDTINMRKNIEIHFVIL